jgi:hypothetical protein
MKDGLYTKQTKQQCGYGSFTSSRDTIIIEGSKKEAEEPNEEFTKTLSTHVSSKNCANDLVNETPQQETGDNTPQQSKDAPGPDPRRQILPQQSKDAPGPDPRRQILEFFSTIGSDKGPRTGKDGNKIILLAENSGDNDMTQASIFTVWRPCSSDAIQKMVDGQGVGKGLDIKGNFVLYLQIHEEAHKSKVQTLERGGRTRIFFASRQARDSVMDQLEPLENHILNAVQDAKRTIKRNVSVVGFGMVVPAAQPPTWCINRVHLL